MCWHLIVSPLPSLKCPFPLLASLPWQFLMCGSHALSWLVHGNYNNNITKHHSHCNCMPMHLNAELQQMSQLTLKLGRPWGTNFPSHTFKQLFLYNNPQGMQPYWSCWTLTLSPSIYTNLTVVDTFSMLLKSLFYQVTFITTIFLEFMVYLWNSQVVTSLPHFQFNSENFSINHTPFCTDSQQPN